jgi:hypothetical protein
MLVPVSKRDEGVPRGPGFAPLKKDFMSTRRRFLQAGAAAAGLAGAAQRTNQPPAVPSFASAAETAVQVPKVKFGGVEISRLVLGTNQFNGYSHFNSALSGIMKEWYTTERVCEIMHRCVCFGINTSAYSVGGNGPSGYERFRAEGGQMHLIIQGRGEPEPILKALKPLAFYHHGEDTDKAFQNGKMNAVREYCKKLRQLGVQVGVGTHKPEVIALVEEQGWDIDFYAGCVYNRTRTAAEWRKMLNGELPLPPTDVYLESDPPRMYQVMRQSKKHCFAFKILAAGRVTDSQQQLDRAFRSALESIKPTDCVFVGMFPRDKDEVKDNAERMCRVLGSAPAA